MNVTYLKVRNLCNIKECDLPQNLQCLIPHFLSHDHNSQLLISHFCRISDHSQSFIPHFQNSRPYLQCKLLHLKQMLIEVAMEWFPPTDTFIDFQSIYLLILLRGSFTKL